jgi:HPt (histidine-containing phosphotransfer) domain-containing protein
MAIDALDLVHVEGVYTLLDQLQVGFLLVDPDGKIKRASYVTRRLFARAALARPAPETLGEAVWEALCAPVLAGRSGGERWRDLEIVNREGTAVPMSLRSTAVAFPDGRHGVLVALSDISAEVGLHERYKALLGRQEEINRELRREISAVLREHEDDIAQFSELLQIAPSIFASFLTEAESAVAQAALLVEGNDDAEAMVTALRALHTLKGNARGLGLNFIAGRAHEVEELLTRRRRSGGPDSRDPAASAEVLAELVVDLRRAVERTGLLRRRLGERGVDQPAGDAAAPLRGLADIGEVLGRAIAALDGHPEAAALLEARATLDRMSRAPLEQLFEFVRATARIAASAEGLESPLVECSGGRITVAPAVYDALSTALPHLVRNAVCHGIEPAAIRRAAGKASVGHISLVAREEPGTLRLILRDDGRGLDRDRLRAEARRAGLTLGAGDDGLVAALFTGGLSTAEATTYDRGRGLGASAANEAVARVDGTIAVWSEAGQGVEFAIAIPIK